MTDRRYASVIALRKRNEHLTHSSVALRHDLVALGDIAS